MPGRTPRATNLEAGIIEGFFGRPWGWPARLGSVDFLKNSGFRFYIYALKAVPFLRRRWREPLPAETLLHLSQLRTRCRDLGLSFDIGLTPFEFHHDDTADARSLLRSKVLQFNNVGVDLLCILFHDMRGDADGLALIQARVIYNVSAWSTARRCIVCPTY